ncbi:DNA recombination protein RmuC [Marilutibacter spongiae]|uniref:DNA recombination protein RmuC n=1 Tax=Marilutibacter spongiae TaxID=2025720 RepID=A0A7W3TNK2_9GAMM|nr:DNA recombination protein RmuC [Lysobacter spongiae]MBB1061613.1 DNA recombination protein RmuC [Lysobacter spongiae]
MPDIQVLVLILLLAVLVAVGLLVVLLLRRPDVASDPSQARLRDELNAERDARQVLAAEAARLQERLASREGELESAHARTGEALAQVAALDGESTRLRQARSEMETELARARAHLEHGERANLEMKQFLEQAQQRLSAAFAELAGKTFSDTVKSSAERSRSDIEVLLKPFADRIGEFRQRVDVLYAEEAKERASLAGAVNELKSLNQDMAQRALELTRALRGNAKVRGDWGELMLESVLRGSGLQEGEHYERQHSTSDADGRMLRPDIVVRLPDDRRIVVDSKVNLIAWQEAMNAEEPLDQQDALRRHAVALRQHVKDLAERDYPRAMGEDTLEVTVAFVPIEGALSAALGADAELQAFAFDRRVVLASPNTLMAVLRVVDRLWTRDRVQKQAMQISRSGGLLIDALNGFLADFDKVDERLRQARESYDGARRRLTESPQSVMERARRLEAMGARGKKLLPADDAESESPGRLPQADGPALGRDAVDAD